MARYCFRGACTTVCLVALLPLSLALAQKPPAAANIKALRFAKVWDGSGPVRSRAVIVIRGNRITEIGRDLGKYPPGSEVIDLRRYSAIPGMIDVHTHITYYWDRSPGSNPRRQTPRHPAVAVALAEDNAKRTLACGVTTVRDLNS